MMQQDMIIGRQREIDRLQQCLREETPQLIIVYGRRRVGKTFLINSFFEGRFDFKLTGVFKGKKELQLENFINELNRQSGARNPVPKTWTKAFFLLREYLNSLNQEEKHVVFLDEMPWMDTKQSDFLPAFEFFWNDFGCTQKNLVVVLCGSATSWMQKKIAENKGGLFGRQTCSLFLFPFTLHETEEYLVRRGIEWSRYDIAGVYMVLGGIPFYLSLLRQDLSMNENIDNLFFRKRAELWDEFDHLYQTLFSNSGQYIKTMEVISRSRSGMTREELVKNGKMPNSGVLTDILEDLIASGFLRAYQFFGKKKQQTRYQVSDYYSLFYFRFLAEMHGRDEHYWSHTLDNPSRRAWSGLTFEQICKDHIPQIKQKLGISGVLAETSSWFIHADEEEGNSGAQIDLIIDRRDHVINLCEIKYALGEYDIDKDYSLTLRNKIEAFRKATMTKKTIMLTLITTYGVKQNKYSSLVNSQVTLNDLFA